MDKSELPQTVSIVVPVYNEEVGLPKLYRALCSIRNKVSEQLEFIFVDDGSRDASVSLLHELAAKDPLVRVIELSRNFGKEIAMTAGLHAARGDAAITMDADLQHPPKLIPQFISRWHDGADVVVGVRKSYGKVSVAKRFNSWLFYKILNTIADVKIVPASTDFRLLDRAVLDEFNRFTERNRLTRGLIDWLGFERDYIEFDVADRVGGTAGYGFVKLMRLAVNSFVGLSLFPLKLAGYLGIAITMFAALAGSFVFVEKYLLHDPLRLQLSGTIILTEINMLLIGIVLMSLGLVALYVANIHVEISNRPLYVTRKSRKRSPRLALPKEETSSQVLEAEA